MIAMWNESYISRDLQTMTQLEYAKLREDDLAVLADRQELDARSHEEKLQADKDFARQQNKKQKSSVSEEKQDWQLRASCRGLDTDMFYSQEPEIIEQAKAVCGQCAVKAVCLDDAMANEDFGVWGGTSANERKNARRQHRSNPKRPSS